MPQSNFKNMAELFDHQILSCSLIEFNPRNNINIFTSVTGLCKVSLEVIITSNNTIVQAFGFQ